jgi:hypothetical protein
MRNIMVDLETLGTVPGCCIMSIGAIDFCEDGMGDRDFYKEISIESCRDKFLTIDPKTEKWWSERSADARKTWDRCKIGGDPLDHVLSEFAAYIRSFGRDAKVWGNGSDFDNAILAVAYEVIGAPTPWGFRNSRCYRTLKAMHPDVRLERVGTYHNALDDARSQAEHAARLLLRQRDCTAVWGETQDDATGEGLRAPVQPEGSSGFRRSEPEADSAGDGLSRPSIPTGLRGGFIR